MTRKIIAVTESKEFEMLCRNEIVLKILLAGLHKSKGDYLERIMSNRSLRYADYEQFIWWVFNYLGKRNRRVIPSYALWKIRNCFLKPNVDYVNHSEGKKD